MARQIIKMGEILKSAWDKVNANFEELYTSAATIVNKVDKEAGKGLSENDYTTTEKNKLNGIEAGAQVNVIESVKVNGTALSVSSKAVNIDLSTYLANKVDTVSGKGLSTNDFTNDYKTKLDGLSAPNKHTFLAGGWGSATDGIYTMTIAAAGKYPAKVFRQNGSTYEEALVQTAVSGNNVVLTSEEAFAGYVVLI